MIEAAPTASSKTQNEATACAVLQSQRAGAADEVQVRLGRHVDLAPRKFSVLKATFMNAANQWRL